MSAPEDIIRSVPPERVSRAGSLVSGQLQVSYEIFAPGDVGRVIKVGETKAVITAFVSDSVVEVVDYLSNLPLADEVVVAWTFAEHRTYATAISVGGTSPDIYNYLAGQSFSDWPTIVTCDWSS